MIEETYSVPGTSNKCFHKEARLAKIGVSLMMGGRLMARAGLRD